MKHSLKYQLSIIILASFSLTFGCDRRASDGSQSQLIGSEPPPEIEPSHQDIDQMRTSLNLRWSSSSRQGSPSVELSYHRQEGQRAPRTAELFISYPEMLRFVGSEALSSVRSAGKDLIVQEHVSGVLRVIIMGTGNLNTLESGPLAQLNFEGRLEDGQSILIQERRSYFAPSNANLGITIGAPLSAQPLLITE
jgi:hypothetical protein